MVFKRVLYFIPVLILFCIFSELSGMNIQREIMAERVRLREIKGQITVFRQLLEERQEIQDLYEKGNNAEIRTKFLILAEIIENAYIDGDLVTLDDTHMRMKYLYRGIDIVADLYLFYDALYHYLNGDVTETLNKMNEVTLKYPNSAKINKAVSFTQAIYLVRNMNGEYIEIYEAFPELSTVRSRYWLAQAYYNLERYGEAKEHFSQTKNDSRYGFRSELMLGMIAFANFHNVEAMRVFARAVENYPPEEPYYDFAVLALARIYAQLGFWESSIQYYNRYYAMSKGQLTTELLYEMALIAKEADRESLALNFLREIISLPYTSSLFDKALAQIAIIRADQDDISSARQIVEDVIENNKAFIELMTLRSDRVDVLRTEIDSFLSISGADKEEKQEEINTLFNQITAIQERQNNIGDYGVNQEELRIIDFATEEYSLLLKTVIDLDDIIDKIALQSNEEKSQSFVRQAANMDSLRVDLLTLLFLSDMTIDSSADWSKVLQPSGFHRRLIVMNEMNEKIINSHRDARSIARSIVEYENILRLHRIRKDSPNEQAAIQSVIDLLYLEAESHFGEIDRNDQYVISLQEESDALFSSRNQLMEISEIVAQIYHQRLADRLTQTNRMMFDDSEYIHTSNANRINNFVYDLDDMNMEYNYALLDVQFKEIMKMERDFKIFEQAVLETEDRQLREEMWDE